MVWDVESAEWVRGLSDDDILAATDEGSFQRGLDYAARGMVQQIATLNRGRVVVAKVAGTERDGYQTIVSLHSDPGDAVVEWGPAAAAPWPATASTPSPSWSACARPSADLREASSRPHRPGRGRTRSRS
ncbi:hypothetical protein [Janibacter indicus]|uniref:hypothetical protein n=1 Tax=Janibacter indicus TaxID=857417 RepID=UPI003D9A6564